MIPAVIPLPAHTISPAPVLKSPPPKPVPEVPLCILRTAFDFGFSSERSDHPSNGTSEIAATTSAPRVLGYRLLCQVIRGPVRECGCLPRSFGDRERPCEGLLTTS